MSQAPGEIPKQPATERAEALLDNVGQRIGLFAALTARRVQNAASSIRDEADRLDQPSTSPVNRPELPTIAQAEAGGKQATERAEELVDQLGQRISFYTAITSLQVRRAAARLREEAEDIWAEAQNMRQEKGRQ